jgi:hypothetical protein
MRCPGCGHLAPSKTFPPSLDPIEDQPSDDPWWCPSCLAGRLLAAHPGDCRCGGCRPDRPAAA